MINFGKYLINKKIIEGPYYWNILFGNIAGLQANLSHLSFALAEIPEDHFVSIAGLANDQLPMNATAVALGYGVRVGIEDNIWWDTKRTKYCTNLELVKRIHQLIEIHQKEFFEPKEFGELGFYNRKKNSICI
jgi:3-keto-5-aminohexanoate cleavage enzyme